MLKKWNRIGATVIDASIITLLAQVTYWLLLIPFSHILTVKGGGQPIDLVLDFSRYLFSISWSIFVAVMYVYLSIKYMKNTFGRLLLKVHVISNKSTSKKVKEITNDQLIKRELYKWTLIYASFYLYAIYVGISIVTNKQRFYYDKVADTKVEVWV